jgi:hypothetical protein
LGRERCRFGRSGERAEQSNVGVTLVARLERLTQAFALTRFLVGRGRERVGERLLQKLPMSLRIDRSGGVRGT